MYEEMHVWRNIDARLLSYCRTATHLGCFKRQRSLSVALPPQTQQELNGDRILVSGAQRLGHDTASAWRRKSVIVAAWRATRTALLH